MKTFLQTLVMLVLSTAMECSAQGNLQITFDGPPIQPPDSAYTITNYVESGISFLPIPPGYGFTRVGEGLSSRPQDGSAYLAATVVDSLMFSFTDRSIFNLVSVDLAGYSTVVPDFDVQFIGYRSDGSTVSAEFTGSGINFQNYSFEGLGFYDLTRVEVPTSLWSLDNLVVSVPEPGAGNLLVLGGLVLCTMKLRRRR